MPEREDTIPVPMPEDAAVITARLAVIAYVREDGSNGYMVWADGDMPMTTYLGMTVIAQQDICGWRGDD